MSDTDGRGLAALAALLADPTRAAMCLALLDGRAWTSGELARHTGVAASTASEHLTRLVEGGLLAEERQGRHRYVRLAGPGSARLVEGMAAHAAPDTRPVGSLGQDHRRRALARARTCYDHLAGALGVSVARAMAERGLLTQDTGWAITPAGLSWFADLGIDLPRAGKRPLARSCLDWTERRPHLAGAAGAALASHTLAEGWCERIRGGRALLVTERGAHALDSLLGLEAATFR
ncbi:ArsR/SmtB family transcription factor [Nocardiopsis terrae]